MREALLKTEEQEIESAEKLHVGKRVLLKATAIYGRKPPRGEENYLFQYIVAKVNPGCDTAKLEYENKYIEEGGTEFKSYPDNDISLDDYRLVLLKDDAELYRKYLRAQMRVINDRREEETAKEAAKKISASEDVSDIDKKIIEDNRLPYSVLQEEFEPCGDRIEHRVTKGSTNVGEVTVKQEHSKFFCLYQSYPISLHSYNVILVFRA